MGQACTYVNESKYTTGSKVIHSDTCPKSNLDDANDDMEDIPMVTSTEVDLGDQGSESKEGGVWVVYDIVQEPAFKLLDDPIIVSSFPCPCDVHSICPNIHGQAWTSDMLCNDIALIDDIGYVIQKITCLSFVDDICLADDRAQTPFLLCSRKKTVMDLRCPKVVFTTEDKPSSLCYVGENHVVVGSKQRITKYTNRGHLLHSSTRLDCGIIWPWRIKQCPASGNIGVVDTDLEQCGGKGKATILVLDSSLKFLFRYRGKGTAAALTSSFEPCDMAFDSYGNFVVADYNSHTLELISNEGQHLKTLHTDTGRIQAVGVQTGIVGVRPREEESQTEGSQTGTQHYDSIWAAFYYVDDEEEMDQIKIFKYYS